VVTAPLATAVMACLVVWISMNVRLIMVVATLLLTVTTPSVHTSVLVKLVSLVQASTVLISMNVNQLLPVLVISSLLVPTLMVIICVQPALLVTLVTVALVAMMSMNVLHSMVVVMLSLLATTRLVHLVVVLALPTTWATATVVVFLLVSPSQKMPLVSHRVVSRLKPLSQLLSSLLLV